GWRILRSRSVPESRPGPLTSEIPFRALSGRTLTVGPLSATPAAFLCGNGEPGTSPVTPAPKSDVHHSKWGWWGTPLPETRRKTPGKQARASGAADEQRNGHRDANSSGPLAPNAPRSSEPTENSRSGYKAMRPIQSRTVAPGGSSTGVLPGRRDALITWANTPVVIVATTTGRP